MKVVLKHSRRVIVSLLCFVFLIGFLQPLTAEAAKAPVEYTIPVIPMDNDAAFEADFLVVNGEVYIYEWAASRMVFLNYTETGKWEKKTFKVEFDEPYGKVSFEQKYLYRNERGIWISFSELCRRFSVFYTMADHCMLKQVLPSQEEIAYNIRSSFEDYDYLKLMREDETNQLWMSINTLYENLYHFNYRFSQLMDLGADTIDHALKELLIEKDTDKTIEKLGMLIDVPGTVDRMGAYSMEELDSSVWVEAFAENPVLSGFEYYSKICSELGDAVQLGSALNSFDIIRSIQWQQAELVHGLSVINNDDEFSKSYGFVNAHHDRQLKERIDQMLLIFSATNEKDKKLAGAELYFEYFFGGLEEYLESVALGQGVPGALELTRIWLDGKYKVQQRMDATNEAIVDMLIQDHCWDYYERHIKDTEAKMSSDDRDVALLFLKSQLRAIEGFAEADKELNYLLEEFAPKLRSQIAELTSYTDDVLKFEGGKKDSKLVKQLKEASNHLVQVKEQAAQANQISPFTPGASEKMVVKINQIPMTIPSKISEWENNNFHLSQYGEQNGILIYGISIPGINNFHFSAQAKKLPGDKEYSIVRIELAPDIRDGQKVPEISLLNDKICYGGEYALSDNMDLYGTCTSICSYDISEALITVYTPGRGWEPKIGDPFSPYYTTYYYSTHEYYTNGDYTITLTTEDKKYSITGPLIGFSVEYQYIN